MTVLCLDLHPAMCPHAVLSCMCSLHGLSSGGNDCLLYLMVLQEPRTWQMTGFMGEAECLGLIVVQSFL